MKNYYILKDLNGYGNFHPVCVTYECACRLMEEWFPLYLPFVSDEPKFEDIWRIAGTNDMEKYGMED